jgi:hypothetical protein
MQLLMVSVLTVQQLLTIMVLITRITPVDAFNLINSDGIREVILVLAFAILNLK